MKTRAIQTMETYGSLSGPPEVTETTMPKEINSIVIGYDGGRFDVQINGVEVFRTGLAGIDFRFEIEVGRRTIMG